MTEELEILKSPYKFGNLTDRKRLEFIDKASFFLSANNIVKTFKPEDIQEYAQIIKKIYDIGDQFDDDDIIYSYFMDIWFITKDMIADKLTQKILVPKTADKIINEFIAIMEDNKMEAVKLSDREILQVIIDWCIKQNEMMGVFNTDITHILT